MLQQPQFIVEAELTTYGLPTVVQDPNILSKVRRASTLIDQYCGRQTVGGNGSLIYTTYSERLLLPEGRNIIRCSYRPLVAIDAATFNSYAASATNLSPSGINTQLAADGATLSPLVSATGRYGYGRRASQQVYPDLNYGANILQIASYFGGPPQFTPINISLTDFNPLNGEIWVPAGLYLSQYTEIFIVYNSGFPPNVLPSGIKEACAMLIFNFLTRPASGMTSFTVAGIHHQFTPSLVDDDVDRMLGPFKTVVGM